MTRRARVAARRGYALLVTLCLLALLALLATMYVNLARTERHTAASHVLQVRARMLAQSGAEMAAARLRALLRERAWSDPRPAAVGGDGWIFRNNDGSPARVSTAAPAAPLDVGHGIPLTVADHPSLETSLPPAGPPGATASGFLPATFQERGDYYLLKILDCTSQLNLNLYAGPSAPDYALPAADPHAQLLVNLLTRLGQAISATVPDPPGYTNLNPLEPADIAAIRAARTVRVFGTKAEVETLYRTNYGSAPPGGIADDPARGRAKWEKLRDFVSVAGLARGEGVVGGRPSGYQGEELPQPVFGVARDEYPAEDSWTDRREPLIPVNVNTAPYPVLFALLAAGLNARAMRVDEVPSPRPGIGAVAVVAKPAVPPISDAEAAAIARALVLARQETFTDTNGNQRYDAGEPFVDLDGDGRYEGPFKCFRDLLDWAGSAATNALVAGDDETRREKWAMILANANPNTLYNKSNLDWPAPRAAETFVDLALVDRTDLAGWTTFFVFGPLGYFEIESIGRVIGIVDGATGVAAEQELHAVYRIARHLHHTTQRDFEANAAGSTALTHPESMRDILGTFHPGAAADIPILDYDGRIEISGENAPAPGGTLNLRFQDGYAGTPGGAPLDPSPARRRDEYGAGAASKTVLRGSDLLPDGTLSVAALGSATKPAPKALYYPTGTSVNLLASGSLEFFIKLMKRGDQGTDEAWVFAVQDDLEHDVGGPDGGDVWIAWKLEYFGGAVQRLVSTRFYFLNSPLRVNSPTSPWRFAYSERAHDVSRWRAHEWHHVSVSWTDAGLDGGPSHVFRVDGDGGAAEFDLPAETFEKGGGVNGGDRTTRNLFTLRSNVAVERMSLGGYSVQGNDRDIYYSFLPKGVSMTRALLHRFVGATMDEVTASASPAPAAPPARFSTQATPGAGAARHRGQFVLPADLPAGAELGTLAWTAYFPKAYAGLALPSAGIRLGIQFQGYRDGAPATSPIAPAHVLADGSGVPFLAGARAAGPGTQVDYEIFLLHSGTAPLNVTPILDDVTLTVLIPTRIVEWRWGSE